MITKQELKLLSSLKSFKGLSIEEIEKELLNLVASQKYYKELEKNLDKINKEKDKLLIKIESLNKELSSKNKKIIELDLKLNSTRKEISEEDQENRSRNGYNNGLCANTHQLSRIICFLKDTEREVTRNEICKTCGLAPRQGNAALNFLLHYDIIKEKRGKYYIGTG